MKTKRCLLLLAIITTVNLSFAQTLVKKMSSANGNVYAVYKSGSSYYIGGDFNYVGLNTGYGALTKKTDDYPNMDFPQFNGQVYTLVPDNSGGWYAGGSFTTVGGVAKSYLAHIKSDNTVDAAFTANCNSTVRAILRVAGRLYIGGNFTTVNGTARNYAAAVNPTTGALLLGWNPSPNGSVNTITAVFGADTSIWLGGTFTTINTSNISRPYLAKVNNVNGSFINGAFSTDSYVNKLITRGDSVFAAGYFTRLGLKTDYLAAIGKGSSSADQSMPNTNGSIRCIIPDGAGGWYVGGYFTQIGGISKSYIARVKSDKTVDATFTATCNYAVLAIVKDATKLYLGGAFTLVNGVTRNYLAAVNASTGALNATWTASANNWVNTLALRDTTVLAGGYFSSINNKNAYRFAVLSKTNGNPIGGYPGFNSTVNKLAVRGDSILVGGSYYQSAYYSPYSAAITTTTTNPNPNFPATNGSIYCVVRDGAGNYYVGGSFTQIGGVNQAYVAKLNPSFQVIAGWAPVVNSYVHAMALSGTTLYIGGQFTSTNAVPRQYISALNTVSPGNNKTWNSSLNYHVYALALDSANSALYAGGRFSLVNGATTRNLLAKFNLTGGLDATWNPNAAGGGGSVEKLIVTGTNVLAGGSFTSIGGVARNYLAKLNKTNGASVNWASANSYIFTMYSDGTLCYVGGYLTSLTSAGGSVTLRNYIGAVNISNGAINSFNPSPNSYVYAIQKTGTTVYFGGQFTLVNGTDRKYLAAANATNNTLLAWNPSANNSVGTIYLNTSNNNIILGGNFSGFKETSRSYASVIRYGTKAFAPWNPVIDNAVYDINYNVNKIFIGGAFHTVNGSARNGLAAFNLTGTLVGTNLNLTKNGTIYSTVWSLYPTDTTIYVGGDFDKAGATVRNNFVEANISTGAGTILATNANVDNTVYDIDVKGTTIIYGGDFRFSKYTSRNYLCIFRNSTGAILPWNPAPSHPVFDVAYNYSRIFAVGQFDNIGGTTHTGAAAFNLTGGGLLAWDPQLARAGQGYYADLNAVAADSNNVYLGGYFDHARGAIRNNAAAVSATTAALQAWNPGPNYIVETITLNGTNVILGGNFTYCKGASRSYIAKIDSATGLVNASWNPGTNGYVYAITGSGTNIYIGGNYTQLGGLTRTSLGAVNASTGATTIFDPVIQNNGYSGTVNALVIDTSNILYVGGTFTTAKGATARNNAAAFAIGGAGALQSWNPNTNGAVNALAKKGSTIYMGGNFTSLNGGVNLRNYLASVNNTSGTALAFNPNMNSYVHALSLSGNNLYVGGQFYYVNNNNTQRSYLASYNVTTGNLNTWNPVANSYVFGLASSTDTVYPGGYFTTLNGTARVRLAGIRGAAGTTLLPFNPEMNSTVWENYVSGHVLLTGGSFSTVGGRLRNGFAVFILPGGNTNKSSNTDDLYVNTVPKQFSIYPNPASTGTIMLKLNEAVSGKFTIKITAMDGKQVFQKVFEPFAKNSIITVNRLNLQNGTYIVNVTGSKTNWSSMLVISK